MQFQNCYKLSFHFSIVSNLVCGVKNNRIIMAFTYLEFYILINKLTIKKIKSINRMHDWKLRKVDVNFYLRGKEKHI